MKVKKAVSGGGPHLTAVCQIRTKVHTNDFHALQNSIARTKPSWNPDLQRLANSWGLCICITRVAVSILACRANCAPMLGHDLLGLSSACPLGELNLESLGGRKVRNKVTFLLLRGSYFKKYACPLTAALTSWPLHTLSKKIRSRNVRAQAHQKQTRGALGGGLACWEVD